MNDWRSVIKEVRMAQDPRRAWYDWLGDLCETGARSLANFGTAIAIAAHIARTEQLQEELARVARMEERLRFLTTLLVEGCPDCPPDRQIQRARLGPAQYLSCEVHGTLAYYEPEPR